MKYYVKQLREGTVISSQDKYIVFNERNNENSWYIERPCKCMIFKMCFPRRSNSNPILSGIALHYLYC